MAASEGRPVARERIAESLWPEATRSQQAQSLRTEIAALRSAFGPDAPFEINRTTMRLVPERATTDYPPTPGDFDRLAPEMPEPWFVSLRRGQNHEVATSSLRTIASPPEALFENLLLWSVEDNPGRTIELMRASPELTCSLVPAVLQRVCGMIRPAMRRDDEGFGWFRFFEGFALGGHGTFDESLRAFREASEFASRRKDRRLFADTLLWETAVLIVMGRAVLAERHCERAYTFIEARDRDSLARVLHAHGLAYHHCGRFAEGDATLRAALEMPFYQAGLRERAHLLSHMALFRAAHGDVRGATDSLEKASEFWGHTNEWRLKGVRHLTQTLMWLGPDPEAAEKELALLTRHADLVQSDDLTIYAEETLARLRAQENDTATARRHLRQSLSRRREAQMGLTRWDRDRLQPVIAALERT